MAERDAAVHAARALAPQLLVGLQPEVLLVVGDALGRVALVKADAVDLQERSELTHCFDPRSEAFAVLLASGPAAGTASRSRPPH